MNALKKLLLGILALAAATAVVVAVLVYLHSDPIPAGTDSAARLASGPYRVAVHEHTLTDTSRPTDANGTYPGAASRQLPIKVWQPQRDSGAMPGTSGGFPLLVYSHGFSGTRDDPQYLARFLASHGYVLVAMDFPLTNLHAPDGPAVMDVINQPGDVSFVIDTLLDWNTDPDSVLYRQLDPERIALIGHSLGGMTTVLATYQPRLRDPRVAAAVSLAGPLEMFGRQLFAPYDTPFLMLASDTDPMVDYHKNAGVLLQRVNHSVLVSLHRASHTGFTDQARYLRFLDNPDRLGCAMVATAVNEETPMEDMPLYDLLGSEQEGILRAPPEGICLGKLEPAMPVGRQHDLTKLAVQAFLGAVFDAAIESRQRDEQYLRATLPREIDAVRVAGDLALDAVPP